MEGAGENVVAFRANELRHRKASREAIRRDRIWFRKRSDRFWRARPFIPHELKLLDGEERNITLVYRDLTECNLWRVALTMKDMKPDILPDDDAFLGNLWFYIKSQRQPGKPITVDPLAHLLLLNAAGHNLGGAA